MVLFLIPLFSDHSSTYLLLLLLCKALGPDTSVLYIFFLILILEHYAAQTLLLQLRIPLGKRRILEINGHEV